MNLVKKQYKSIFITDQEDICIFYFADSYSRNEESAIMSISQFVEYVGYKFPQFVVIEKSGTIFDYTLLNSFLKKIIGDLKSFGVREIFFIVDPERYEEIRNLRATGQPSYRGIDAFPDLDSCLIHIKNNKKALY